MSFALRHAAWLWLLLPLIAHGQPEPSPEDVQAARQVLGAYEGTWSGEYSLELSGTNSSRTFSLEQRYWWEKGVLHGVSVYDKDGELSYAQSRSFVLNERLLSEIEQDGETRRYQGRWADGTIVWLPLNPREAMLRQTKEKIEPGEDGTPTLVWEGFERLQRDGQTLMVLYRGRLEKVSERGQ
ncbi:MAG: hypothetical protein ACOCVG_04390 [Verrucomicrobiota bacterium]